MKLIPHQELRDKHAFLSPSNCHWLKYDPNKLKQVYMAQLRKAEGTRLHALAKELIILGIRLPDTDSTLNAYVNDCITCHLTPEQPLFYSWNCYGTADAIGFDGRMLRIFDLKTGLTPANMNQLKIYAALFFLEYAIQIDMKPEDVDAIELRIYQNDEVRVELADAFEIRDIMNHIILCDQTINELGGERMLWNSEY